METTGRSLEWSGEMTVRVGIVGVGVMGSAMGTNLLAAGFSVTGFDVVPEAAGRLVPLGGAVAGSPAEVANVSDVVLLSLPTVGALEEAVSGSGGLIETTNTSVVCVEMGTLPLDAKEAAKARLAGVGIELLDVPVSGTGIQAADATLVVFASGDEEAFHIAEPVFGGIGRSTYYLGEFGNGSKMKYIANLLVAVHNLATAEAHALGLAAGMDPATVQQVMSDGIGGSKILDVRGPMMVRDEYQPPSARLDIILKDATIIKAFAEQHGAPTPLLDATIPVYEASKAAGLGSEDAAALCRYLEQIGDIHRA
jgi:3-hydroxyisobutyrate dehydrogenase-like beta-hydroxyacid dehydrogenase